MGMLVCVPAALLAIPTYLLSPCPSRLCSEYSDAYYSQRVLGENLEGKDLLQSRSSIICLYLWHKYLVRYSTELHVASRQTQMLRGIKHS